MSSRSNLFQNIGTILALVISVLALFVSIYEANIMRSQQKAMVWPYVTIETHYNNEGFSLIASNNGTGPALIKSMEMTYAGKQLADYIELLDQIKPDRVIGYDRLRMDRLNNTVMKPGEERIMFRMPWDDETRSMLDEIRKADIKIQYCSVLEDCWIYDMDSQERKMGTFKAKLEFEN